MLLADFVKEQTVGRELGRFLEHRRGELGLTRRELATRAELSYPYISQLETGDREPALKALHKLAPVLQVRPEELAALLAGGEWLSTSDSTYESTPPRTVKPTSDTAASTGTRSCSRSSGDCGRYLRSSASRC